MPQVIINQFLKAQISNKHETQKWRIELLIFIVFVSWLWNWNYHWLQWSVDEHITVYQSCRDQLLFPQETKKKNSDQSNLMLTGVIYKGDNTNVLVSEDARSHCPSCPESVCGRLKTSKEISWVEWVRFW